MSDRLRPFPAPLPARMSRLQVDKRGYPVPAFVAWYGGEPDFRVVDGAHFGRCARGLACWICGDRLGSHLAFVLGPDGPIKRVHTEPPSHRDCAEFAVQACPFMVRPQARHREANMPEAGDFGGGNKANPGCAVVWITKGYTTFTENPVITRDVTTRGSKTLFKIGDPVELQWWTQGRRATPDEAAAFLEAAISDLHEQARAAGVVDMETITKLCDDARQVAGGRRWT